MRRVASSVVLLGLAAVVMYLNRDVLADTITSAQEVSTVHLCMLALIAVILVFARGAFVSATIPGLSIKRATLADQVALSAAYAIVVGGGPVGVAAKVKMFSFWGASTSAIGASLVATAVIPTFSTWLPAVVVHTPIMMNGDASRVELLAVAVGVVTIVFNVLFWLGVLYLQNPIRIIASFSQWTQKTIADLVPKRLSRARHVVGSFDTNTFVHSTRGDLRQLIRTRGIPMLGSTFLVTSVSLTAFLVSLRAFNVEGISLVEALSAFTLLRVVVALSPLPGGVGLAEISSVALLTNYGAQEVNAVGATLLYRAVVWLTPMVVGGISWWLWSRRNLWSTETDVPTSSIGGSVSTNPECRECHLCHPQMVTCVDWSDSLATNQ